MTRFEGALDTALLDVATSRLGFDRDDRTRLLDLTAVGITRLAWRDSPVENWHSLPLRRINNGEMMRANAAATRLVRGILEDHLQVGSGTSGWRVPVGVAGLFAAVRDVLADPGRRIPDGRTLAELAPDRSQLVVFEEHVRTFCEVWTRVADDIGLSELVVLIACHAATFSRDGGCRSGGHT